MSKCQIAVLPARKVREVLDSPSEQKKLQAAKQHSQDMLDFLREARRIDPKQLKEPYNL